MRIQVAVPEEHVDPAVINASLEAVTRLNENMIRAGDSPTSDELVERGAVWRPENMGDEHFDHGGTIAERGWGDCDDWAPLHAATLRVSQEDPEATAVVIPSGPSTYHAVVQRGDGRLELGDEDISARAGMRPIREPAVVGGAGGAVEAIDIVACDPHDGRVYHGQLLPTVGPLSLHCGPQFSVRGCRAPGTGRPVFQGRCDLPITGTVLHGARTHRKRGSGKGRRVVGGMLPYALSSTAYAHSPGEALSGAIAGAVLCGDLADLAAPLDAYKLMALQLRIQRFPAATVAQELVARIASDVVHEGASQGVDPGVFLQHLSDELAKEGCKVPPDAHAIARAITVIVGKTKLSSVVGMPEVSPLGNVFASL